MKKSKEGWKTIAKSWQSENLKNLIRLQYKCLLCKRTTYYDLIDILDNDPACEECEEEMKLTGIQAKC